jgi:hypothetical protein
MAAMRDAGIDTVTTASGAAPETPRCAHIHIRSAEQQPEVRWVDRRGLQANENLIRSWFGDWHAYERQFEFAARLDEGAKLKASVLSVKFHPIENARTMCGILRQIRLESDILPRFRSRRHRLNNRHLRPDRSALGKPETRVLQQ